MYTNLQNIQPSKSIVESIHESNTGSNVRGIADKAVRAMF